MPTFKLTLAYDGTNFSGWQAQPGRRTVQGVLEEAWAFITQEQVQVTATSRTDAGVHALGQVVGITSQTHLDAATLHRALNARLPVDVAMVEVETVSESFHATRDCIAKRYRYSIHNSRQRPLFERSYVWHVRQTLDTNAMQQAAEVLIGTHDFASFQSVGSPRECTVRTIHALEVRRHEQLPARVEIEVEGDGFLYNMVRILAGSLVEVGTGRRDASWLAAALAARDRRAAGKTAPPHGLCLLWAKF